MKNKTIAELRSLLSEFLQEFDDKKHELFESHKLMYAICRGWYAARGKKRHDSSQTLNSGICFNLWSLNQTISYIIIKFASTRKLYEFTVKYDLWHNKYKSFDDAITTFPSSLSNILAGFLTRNYVLNGYQFQITNSSFEIAFAELIDFFGRDWIEYEWNIFLQGVTGDMQTVKINDEISIIKAGYEFAKFYSINYTDEKHHTIEMFEDDYILRIKLHFPKNYYVLGSNKARVEEEEITKRWKELVLLTLPGYVKFGKVIITSNDWPIISTYAMGPYGDSVPRYFKNETITITENTVSNIEHASNIFFQLPEKFRFEKNIVYAIERLTKAKSSTNIDDRVVELSIAFEFLINTTNSEVTLQLSLKLIKLVFNHNTDATIYPMIKKFYDLRSKIIHGNEKIKSDDKNKEIISFVEGLIQKAALRLIELNKDFTFNKINEALTQSLHVAKSIKEILDNL